MNRFFCLSSRQSRIVNSFRKSTRLFEKDLAFHDSELDWAHVTPFGARRVAPQQIDFGVASLLRRRRPGSLQLGPPGGRAGVLDVAQFCLCFVVVRAQIPEASDLGRDVRCTNRPLCERELRELLLLYHNTFPLTIVESARSTPAREAEERSPFPTLPAVCLLSACRAVKPNCTTTATKSDTFDRV